MYVIYMHTNCITQKSYIGMTSKGLQIRWRQHVNAAKRQSKTIFHNSIRKHGELCWKHVILETHDSYEKAKFAEVSLIAEHKTLEYRLRGLSAAYESEEASLDDLEHVLGVNRADLLEAMDSAGIARPPQRLPDAERASLLARISKGRQDRAVPRSVDEAVIERDVRANLRLERMGYNMTPGGDGVIGFFGDKNPMWKKCHTQEAREKTSKAFRNQKLSIQHRKAISIGKQGMSHESRKRIGDGHKKFLHLRVERIDCDGNIKRYNNIYDAAADVKGEVRRILAVLNGTQKHHKGFLWRNA